MGIGWFLRDVEGVRLVGHSGVATGQIVRLDLAPDHDLAIGTMTNCGTSGARVIDLVRSRILNELLGVEDLPPSTRSVPIDVSAELVGTYETEELVVVVGVEGETLLLTIRVSPCDPKTGERNETGEVFAVPVGLVVGESSDHFVALAGQYENVRGRFVRDDSGVIALDFGGRLARRVDTRRLERP